MCRNKRRFYRTVMFLTALYMSLSAMGCSSGKKEEAELVDQELIVPAEANYKTATVERGDYIYEQTTSARVDALIRTQLTWDKENCRYEDILVIKGDAVQKGDVLATFTTGDSQVTLEEYQVDLKRLRREYASESANRQSEIATAREGLANLSSYDYQAAELRLKRMQSEYEQYCYEMEYQIRRQEETIEEMQEEADRNSLIAPYDGIVEDITYYNPGDKVPVGQPIITLYSTDKLAVYAEDAAHDFAYNQKVTIGYGNRNDPTTIEGRVVATSRILPAELENPYIVIRADEEIPPELIDSAMGQTVTIRAETQVVRDVLLVDRRAVSLDGGRFTVQVLKDGVLHKRYVQLGTSNTNGNGSVVWIVDGVSEGDVLALVS